MTLDEVVRGQIVNVGRRASTFEEASKTYKKNNVISKELKEAVYALINPADLELVLRLPDREFYDSFDDEFKDANRQLAPLVAPHYNAILSDLNFEMDKNGNLSGGLVYTLLETPAQVPEGNDKQVAYAKAIKSAQDWKKAAEAGDLKFYQERASPMIKKAIAIFKDEAKKLMDKRAAIEVAKAVSVFANENGEIDPQAMINYLSENITLVQDKDKAYSIVGRAYSQDTIRQLAEAQ